MSSSSNAASSLRLPISLSVIYGAFTLGFYVAIQGPTLMDLIDLLHVNNDIMSYSLAFASLAYSVGGLLSGFLFNYVNRQILIASYFVVFGTANIVTPYISNYYIFSVITVFKMMCAGGTDCGANVWILELWPGKDAWLQALHFSFAVGCALGPLVVEPFLSVEHKEGEFGRELAAHGGTVINDQNNESRIYIPYGVSGSASILAALLIIYLYTLDEKRKKQASKSAAAAAAAKQPSSNSKHAAPAANNNAPDQHQTQAEQILLTSLQHSLSNSLEAGQPQVAQASKEQQAPNNLVVVVAANSAPPAAPQAPPKITSKCREQLGKPPYYVMFAIALAALSLSFYCGIEITSMNYLATFAVNIDLQLPKSTAALMSSALTISFAVGRLAGIWIAVYVKPHKLFYLCAGIMATGNVLMLVFANTTEKYLWYSICLFGIGCGPMFPAIVSFYDEKISKVTNTVSGIFILGSMFNVALNSIIIGHYIIDNALILIVCNLIGSVLLLLLFGTLHMLTKVKKNQRVRKFKLQQLRKTDGGGGGGADPAELEQLKTGSPLAAAVAAAAAAESPAPRQAEQPPQAERDASPPPPTQTSPVRTQPPPV